MFGKVNFLRGKKFHISSVSYMICTVKSDLYGFYLSKTRIMGILENSYNMYVPLPTYSVSDVEYFYVLCMEFDCEIHTL